MTTDRTIPSVSFATARTGASTKADELGMRVMQQRAYARRGEQYLLIKSPPASGKSRALMFIALDKLRNQGLRQAIIVVPERSIGGSFANEPLSDYGFWADWEVQPQWNLCNAPGIDEWVGIGSNSVIGRSPTSTRTERSRSTRCSRTRVPRRSAEVGWNA